MVTTADIFCTYQTVRQVKVLAAWSYALEFFIWLHYAPSD